MAIPPKILALTDRLNQELEEIERRTLEGLNRVRPNLSRRLNNAILTQSFTYLNNVLLFVDDFRNTIQSETESISGDKKTTDGEIYRVGEDLAALLGVTLEIKIQVGRIITQLENLL